MGALTYVGVISSPGGGSAGRQVVVSRWIAPSGIKAEGPAMWATVCQTGGGVVGQVAVGAGVGGHVGDGVGEQ